MVARWVKVKLTHVGNPKMADALDVDEDRRSPSPSPITTDNCDEIVASPSPQEIVESSPTINRIVQQSPRRSPRRRISATLEDGSQSQKICSIN